MQEKVYEGISEDRITGAIESQTSKVPSSAYLQPHSGRSEFRRF